MKAHQPRGLQAPRRTGDLLPLPRKIVRRAVSGALWGSWSSA